MGTSLMELRRAVGRQLGDVTVLTATQDGSDTKFFDNINLAAGDDIFRGADLYFVSGTAGNIGQLRRSTQSDRSEKSISWSVALPAPTATGDVCEMWNHRSIGFKPLDVNAAINDVISVKATPAFNVPTTAIAALPFDKDSGEVIVPNTLNRIFMVEYKGENGKWYPIPRSNYAQGYGYYVNRGLGTVTISGPDITHHADGADIRFRGYGKLTPLVNDSDETELFAEWIIYEATASLLFQASSRDPDRERHYGPMASRADALRPFAGLRADPNAQVVR